MPFINQHNNMLARFENVLFLIVYYALLVFMTRSNAFLSDGIYFSTD